MLSIFAMIVLAQSPNYPVYNPQDFNMSASVIATLDAICNDTTCNIGDSSSSAANASTAIGGTCIAADHGTAYGQGSISSAYGVAVGQVATASTNGVAIGQASTSSGSNCVAIGLGATCANESVSIGQGSVVAELFSTAIGKFAQALKNYNICIGTSCNASTNTRITAIGADVTMSGQDSSALGYGQADSGFAHSLLLGAPTSATPTASNQAIIGSSTYPLYTRLSDDICIERAGPRAIVSKQPASDIAPYNMQVNATNAASIAAVNQVGGNLILNSGIGTRQVEITNYGASNNDTYAITLRYGLTSTQVTTTLTAKNPATGGAGTFDCITSNAVCATNLATAIDALNGVSAYAVGAVIYVSAAESGDYIPTYLLHRVNNGGGGAIFATTVSGAYGKILIRGDVSSSVSNALIALEDGVSGLGGTGQGVSLVSNGVAIVSTSTSVSGIEKALLIQEDVDPFTCTEGQIRFDTGGATIELCYCQAANTWYCTPMTPGPVD